MDTTDQDMRTRHCGPPRRPVSRTCLVALVGDDCQEEIDKIIAPLKEV